MTTEQCINILLTPKNTTFIQMAAYQDERLRMHCSKIIEKGYLPPTAWMEYESWWKALLPRAKYNIVEKLTTCPLPTVKLTKKIFDQLGKFISSADKQIDFNFSSTDTKNDFAEYVSSNDFFWSDTMLSALKCDISSVIVVDLCEVQKANERPEPYPCMIPSRRFIDIDYCQKSGAVEYVAYRQDNYRFQEREYEKAIFICDEYYRVFSREASVSNEAWGEIVCNYHGLGYCPATPLVNGAIENTKLIVKESPLSSVLEDLNYLLLYMVLSKYIDLYGPFPVTVRYKDAPLEFDDKMRQPEGMPYARSSFNPMNGYQMNDPKKNASSIIGAGSEIQVDPPMSDSDFNPMSVDPIKFIGVNVETLKNIKETLRQKEEEIIETCTGEDISYLNEIAKNEDMKNASFEKKHSILCALKSQFERVHSFFIKTACELRYGKGNLTSVYINYGTDFFLKDSSVLIKELKEAEENGMPQSYVNGISNAVIASRYSSNPKLAERIKLLTELEPYSGMPLSKFKELGLDEKDKEAFVVKSNFMNFISRFERENCDIVSFGKKIPYKEKFSIIKNQLNEYGKQAKLDWGDSGSDSVGNVQPK